MGLLWVNHEWVNRPLTVAELSTEEVVTERAAEVGGEVGGELNGGASSGRGTEHTVCGTAADRPARKDAIDGDGVYGCVAPDATGM